MARTRIPIGNEDTHTFKCKRCGFPLSLDRERTGDGSGITLTAVTIAGKSLYDPIIKRGACPFCGTKNFQDWQR